MLRHLTSPIEQPSIVRSTSREAAARAGTTRLLLCAGMIAGPLYVVVGLVQALTRKGFDLRRHELSLLANGHLGWIQISNLLVTGALTVTGALGWRRSVGLGSRWAPRLIATFGAGMFAAGCFIADPAYGFPPGTPAGKPASVSWHGGLHLVTASIGFLALIVACFVVGRIQARAGRRGLALYSRLSGAAFAAAFVGIATGAGSEVLNVGFGVAVLIGFAWLSIISGKLRYDEGVAQ